MPSSGRSRAIKFADGALGALVGLGDRIEIVHALLVRHFDALAEQGPDHRAGGIGQAIGESDQFGFDSHGHSLARPPSRIKGAARKQRQRS